jgi:ompH family outer membrane protein
MTPKNIYFALLVFLVNFCTFAQKSTRIAYLDMDYILSQLEEYKIASQQLNEKVIQWQKEIEAKQAEIQARKDKLEAEKPLLTAEMLKDREEEIDILERNLESYQQKRFGTNKGDYIEQRWKLAQPIQDQIFNIVQEIGKTKKYDYIFTKEDASAVFAEEKYDITKLVLRLLKRKDNAEDRNKEISELLKENYNYELKDEKTKRKEAYEKQKADDLAKRQAEREKIKQQQAQQRLKRQQEKEEAYKIKQAEREKLKQEKLKQSK